MHSSTLMRFPEISGPICEPLLSLGLGNGLWLGKHGVHQRVLPGPRFFGEGDALSRFRRTSRRCSFSGKRAAGNWRHPREKAGNLPDGPCGEDAEKRRADGLSKVWPDPLRMPCKVPPFECNTEWPLDFDNPNGGWDSQHGVRVRSSTKATRYVEGRAGTFDESMVVVSRAEASVRLTESASVRPPRPMKWGRPSVPYLLSRDVWEALKGTAAPFGVSSCVGTFTPLLNASLRVCRLTFGEKLSGYPVCVPPEILFE